MAALTAKSLSRWLLVVTAGLAVLAAAGIWYERGSLAPPLLNGAASGETVSTAVSGPLRFAFRQPVARASVERRFSIEPPVQGRFVWSDDQEALFYPSSPLASGQAYTVHLAAGVEGAGGQKLRHAQQWQARARQAVLLYLSPSRAPELWRVSPDGSTPAQLTETNGAVYDYTASAEGSLIIYSARNAEDGLDLWKMPRAGGAAEILLACGPDWCFNPALSPDGSRLAYSRRVFSGIAGSAPGTPRLWMMRLATGETDLLFVDPNISGAAAGWSPDGRRLAFVDARQRSVRVVNFDKGEDFSVSTGEDASYSWSPDSRSLFVTRSAATEAFPYTAVYQVDIATRKEGLWVEHDTADYSPPAFSADGKYAAAARRAVDGVPGKQLWLVEPAGRLVRDLTGDALGSYASYQWSPDGRMLVYQRLEITGSESRPEIGIWDRETGELRIIVQDGFLPRWAP